MNDAAEQALVCGFGDLEAGIGALAWDLGEPGALLLSDGEVRPASFAIEEGGDAVTLEVTAGDVEVEANLSRRMAVVREGEPQAARFEATSCAAEVRSKSGSRTLSCPGHVAKWTGGSLEGLATFRHLAIEASDGAHLIVTAEGEPGAAGHGEERTSGWLLSEAGTVFEDTLISTQYDGGGLPTRIGLELWAADADQSSRAGAVRVSGSGLGGVQQGEAWAGLFRCHTDGAEGLGSYLLWRA